MLRQGFFVTTFVAAFFLGLLPLPRTGSAPGLARAGALWARLLLADAEGIGQVASHMSSYV